MFKQLPDMRREMLAMRKEIDELKAQLDDKFVLNVDIRIMQHTLKAPFSLQGKDCIQAFNSL